MRIVVIVVEIKQKKIETTYLSRLELVVGNYLIVDPTETSRWNSSDHDRNWSCTGENWSASKSKCFHVRKYGMYCE